MLNPVWILACFAWTAAVCYGSGPGQENIGGMGIRVTEAHRSKTPSELSKNETWLRADDPTLLIDNGRFVEGTVDGSDAGGVGCRGTPTLPTRCFDWSGTTITVKFTGSTFLRVSLAGSSEWDVIHTSTDQERMRGDGEGRGEADIDVLEYGQILLFACTCLRLVATRTFTARM